MNKKIYTSIVKPQGGLEEVLKKCFLTHLTVYNHSLELLKNNPSISYPDLRESVFRYVTDNKIQHLHIQIIQNETYYQYKKFKRDNSYSQKLLSSIQYFTLILKDYNNGITSVDPTRTKLYLVDQPGYLELPVPLPELKRKDTGLYLNLSYSAMENQFQLSIFEQVK